MANIAKCNPVKNVAWGDDFRDIEEHQQNNKKKWDKSNCIKDLEDNSNEDEDWTKSKEGEMLLQEDSEN